MARQSWSSDVSVPLATLYTSSDRSDFRARTFARATSPTYTRSIVADPSPWICGRTLLRAQSSQRTNTSVYAPVTSIRGPYTLKYRRPTLASPFMS